VTKDEPEFVTLAEMAQRLRVHPGDLRREVEAGGLPAVRIGTKGLLFDPARVCLALRQRARGGNDREDGEANDAS